MTSRGRATRSVTVGSKQSRSPSPPSPNLSRSKRGRIVDRVYLPLVALQTSRSLSPLLQPNCQEGKASQSIEDRVDTLQVKISGLKKELGDWSDRAAVAEADVASLRAERNHLQELVNEERQLSLHYQDAATDALAEAKSEREARIKEREELALVQELVRISTEPETRLSPSLWMM
ncbi:hypothetical protein ONZ45_g6348 [Pleurotus djamor]|nr:hypothetical protein ONZ45_g6348 [Pleurotus djamor]